MNTLNRYISVLAFCLLFTLIGSNLCAQTSNGQPIDSISANNYTARADKQTERISKELKLSESQKKQVSSIYLEFYEKIASIQIVDKTTKLNAIKKHTEEKDDALKKILTDSQYKQYEENMAKAKSSEEKRRADLKTKKDKN